MIISGFLLIIIYNSHRYIVTWINFYNNSDILFGNSIWRWTYDYKVIGFRDFSDLDDKRFVKKRRIRNCTVSLMYYNFFIGFLVSISFLSGFFILILR